MRKKELFNANWTFIGDENVAMEAALSATGENICLPHTWNAKDGQLAGKYKRSAFWYRKTFTKPELAEGEEAWLEIEAAALSAEVFLNGKQIGAHEGGYAAFRVNMTSELSDENILLIHVDNSVNKRIYPQTADFTFFGGLYRNVNMIIVPKGHFALDYNGSCGVKATPVVSEDLKSAKVQVEAWVTEDETVTFKIGDLVATADAKDGYACAELVIDQVHLWNGKKDPFLYELNCCTASGDSVDIAFGCRTFRVDPETGFYLNGEPYHLHGVAKHQDFFDCGNATTPEQMELDMEIIEELGATTVRLAHYQHPQYFYDLCDQRGLIVWAEIPYISSHVPEGNENTHIMMKDLIVQNYHHPSIICWGLSNEITMIGGMSDDLVDNHRKLNDLCHELDKTRLTVMAHVGELEFDSVLQDIPDIASYNLYFGWYTGEWDDNASFMDRYHKMHPDRCIGLSEYGADANYRYQSAEPKKSDYTETYQAEYHEHVIEIMEARPFVWATHVWNMFDFAAAGRNEGGVEGRNQKGLVSYDRKIKKDAFYMYKARWTTDPMVHVCGSRYVDRTEDVTEVKVYSTLPEVSLYVDGKLVETKAGKYTFRFQVPISGEHDIKAVAGSCEESIHVRKVNEQNQDYVLPKKATVLNWFEVDTFKDMRYSIMDSVGDLISDENTREMTLEMIRYFDASVLETPGMLDFISKFPMQSVADRSAKKDCKDILVEFNDKLQQIEKK